jgi:hypothetical protein
MKDFHELNAEELTSVDGGLSRSRSIVLNPADHQSIVLNPADNGRTWGVAQPTRFQVREGREAYVMIRLCTCNGLCRY